MFRITPEARSAPAIVPRTGQALPWQQAAPVDVDVVRPLARTAYDLAERIAMVEDDSLVAALKDEWSTVKDAREQSWSETLAKTQDAPLGSVPAEPQAQARQILKKLLATTILVKPNEPGDWSFGAYTRLEGLLMGGLNHGKVTLYQWEGEPGGFFRDPTMDSFIGPIAGGSDAGDSAVRDTEMAPHTPPTLGSAPAEPWRSSLTR